MWEAHGPSLLPDMHSADRWVPVESSRPLRASGFMGRDPRVNSDLRNGRPLSLNLSHCLSSFYSTHILYSFLPRNARVTFH